jgi:hypothetical protein
LQKLSRDAIFSPALHRERGDDNIEDEEIEDVVVPPEYRKHSPGVEAAAAAGGGGARGAAGAAGAAGSAVHSPDAHKEISFALAS